ncbi:MAG TPA: heme exporter protein CcmB [Dehalococcoidales bacterium]|nr:MAG: heme ABC transporter permease CcmB [Chloroflexi bacterium RBG_16_60_22]HJX13867.1 heme exporter protein CcmB [Dehalococcoidales bacterium]
MSFLKKALAITRKDVLSELRTKEIIFSALVFTVLVIVTFNFAFSASQETTALVAPGILWVTFTFAGVLSLNRAFIPEKEENCLEGLMSSPVSREVIYVGKMLGSLLFMLIIEIIALPVFALLFNLPVFSAPLVTVTFLATVGFVAVGTLFSALAVNTKAREMVLPILFLPMVVPIIISAVKASGLALAGESWGALASWLQIIGAFDAIFLVVSFWVFAFVIEE